MRSWGRIDTRERVRGASLAAAMLLAAGATAMAQAEFPFERELLLDVRPLPGSKRVPIVEIGADGRAQVDLWCRSGTAQVEVAGRTVKFTLGAMREDACTPERARRDDEIAAALAQVTGWRLQGELVVFVGPTELRFVRSTH